MASNDMILEAIRGLEQKLCDKIEKLSAEFERRVKNLEVDFENERIENAKVKERVLLLEKKIREKNLIVFGIEEEDGVGDIEKIQKILRKNLNVVLDAKDVDTSRRLGQDQNNKKRPILVSLTSISKKYDIMKNKHKLKNSQKRIYFNEDLPKELTEKRKLMRDIAKELKENGIEAALKNEKVLVNNEVLNEEQMIELIEETREKRNRSTDSEEGASDQKTKKKKSLFDLLTNRK